MSMHVQVQVPGYVCICNCMKWLLLFAVAAKALVLVAVENSWWLIFLYIQMYVSGAGGSERV